MKAHELIFPKKSIFSPRIFFKPNLHVYTFVEKYETEQETPPGSRNKSTEIFVIKISGSPVRT